MPSQAGAPLLHADAPWTEEDLIHCAALTTQSNNAMGNGCSHRPSRLGGVWCQRQCTGSCNNFTTQGRVQAWSECSRRQEERCQHSHNLPHAGSHAGHGGRVLQPHAPEVRALRCRHSHHQTVCLIRRHRPVAGSMRLIRLKVMILIPHVESFAMPQKRERCSAFTPTIKWSASLTAFTAAYVAV